MLIDHIAIAARDAYRERFLVDKSGGEAAYGDGAYGDGAYATADSGDTGVPPDDDRLGVIELLREEDALPSSTPPDSEAQ